MKKPKVNISNFSLLPLDCLAKICSSAFASPKDVCKAAIISREFKSASESNTVWERFLPPDYEQIILRSVSPPAYTTKKELYLYLSNSLVLLDGGKLGFRMDKLTGKRSLMLSARKLSLAGADTPMHWKWFSTPESRFLEVAELLKTARLGIQAKMLTQILSQDTNYTAHLVYKLIENPHRYGLKFHMKSSVENLQENNVIEGENKNIHYLWLDTVSDIGLPGTLTRGRGAPMPRPQERMDGWTEIQLGEFFSGRGDGDGGEVEIELSDNGDGRWKGGLVIEGIEVRPKKEIKCTKNFRASISIDREIFSRYRKVAR